MDPNLGTITFGTGPRSCPSDGEAALIFARHVDLGGHFIGTANFGGQMGHPEVLLRQSAGGLRERLPLPTKCSMTTRP
jgi:hypothetical protein